MELKKIQFVLIATILFCIGSVQAQQHNFQPKLGLKGGVSISNLYVEGAGSESSKLGFYGGAFYYIPITTSFFVQPELLYMSQGAELNYQEDFQYINEAGRYRYNLNYAQLPITAGYHLNEFIDLHVGFYMALLLNANTESLEETDNTLREVEDFTRNDFNRFDYGLLGGLAINLGGGEIGIRYNYGLNTVSDRVLVDTPLFTNARNHSLQIHFGLRL